MAGRHVVVPFQCMLLLQSSCKLPELQHPNLALMLILRTLLCITCGLLDAQGLQLYLGTSILVLLTASWIDELCWTIVKPMNHGS